MRAEDTGPVVPPTGNFAGISPGNRRALQRLGGRLAGPFRIAEAAEALGIDVERARRLLRDLAAGGWVVRVRRGLYANVPLDAERPDEWVVDPWLVADRLFEPCYVGGWSALEQWGFTEQVFRDVAVVTSRVVRDRHPEVQGTRFRVKVVRADRMFGLSPAWRGRAKARVSDPHHTVADVLDDPAFGGGIRHVAAAVAAYFEGASRGVEDGRRGGVRRDDDRLLDAVERVGNRAGYKRLGFLVERLGIAAPSMVRACLDRRSAGLCKLDPSVEAAGRVLRRWRLRVNAEIPGPESRA